MRKTAIYQRKRSGDPAWFNKWIQSPRWLSGFLIALASCLSIYGLNMLFGRVDPGSVWGIGYGVAATVMFVCVMLYALRRRFIKVKPLHRAWYYLQFHVYGGTLFLLLVLMHTNFQWPNGIMTWWLWMLSYWIVLSGFLGSVLQKWLPSVLNTSFDTEVNINRVQELVDETRTRAEAVVGQTTERVRDFYHQHMAASMGALIPKWTFFFNPSGAIQQQVQPFKTLGKYVGGAEGDQLKELETVFKMKLEIDAQYTLQRALRWWLYLHVPVSVALLILIVGHVVTVLYY